jgi:hypothetical protein
LSNTQPQHSATKKRECFVLSPIGKDNSDERKHADKVFNFLLKPVLKRNDFNYERADKMNVSGVITNQIIERIVNSDLIIAILTYDNPNVFYELALCHVARKPFIQMIEKGKDIPFDTSHVRTISYALDDISTFQETIDKLEDLIQKPTKENDNPISLGLDSLTLKESKEAEQNIKAEILEKLQGIDNKIDNKLGMIQNQIVRQASRYPFDPNYELFAYSDSIVPPPPKNTGEILANNIFKFLLNLSEEEKNELFKRLPFLAEDKKKRQYAEG